MVNRLNATRFINECTALRRRIQEDGLRDKDRRAIRTLLVALLADLERRQEPRQPRSA